MLWRIASHQFPESLLEAVPGQEVAEAHVGLGLALSCDLILAAEHATFALPEIRSGTVADAASIKLPKRIPYHVAMDLLLTKLVAKGTITSRDKSDILLELVE